MRSPTFRETIGLATWAVLVTLSSIGLWAIHTKVPNANANPGFACPDEYVFVAGGVCVSRTVVVDATHTPGRPEFVTTMDVLLSLFGLGLPSYGLLVYAVNEWTNEKSRARIEAQNISEAREDVRFRSGDDEEGGGDAPRV